MKMYSYAVVEYANPHAVTSVGGTTYTYDNNGNVTAIGSLDYTWDWRNRLAGAERTGGGITSYGYDHTGQRVFKATGTATTSYANRYFNLATTTGSATTTKHIFAPDGSLLATVEGGGVNATTTYLHPDHLGGTNVTTDEDGEVTQTLDYYPFGSQRIATGSFDEQRRFIGEEYDGDTEFSYLNARYYQGSRGQFMSQDPVFVNLGVDKRTGAILADPQLFNSYIYSRNNPLVYKDQSGEFGVIALVGVGALVGVAHQGLSDWASGQPVTWQNYAGAAAGGAIGSLALVGSVATGFGVAAPGVAGAAGGIVREATSQSLNILSGESERHNWLGVAQQGVMGGGIAYLPLPVPKVARVTVGKGSFVSTARQTVTNLANSSSPVQNFTLSTGSKILTADTIKGAPSAVISGALSNPGLSSTLSSSAQSTLSAFVSLLRSIGI